MVRTAAAAGLAGLPGRGSFRAGCGGGGKSAVAGLGAPVRQFLFFIRLAALAAQACLLLLGLAPRVGLLARATLRLLGGLLTLSLGRGGRGEAER